MILNLNKKEIEDLLMSLDQCKAEGYINSGDPAYTAMEKLQRYYNWLNEMELERDS